MQGRLNDLGLMVAASPSGTADGPAHGGGEELLGVVARYIRLFHILFYASVTTRFAALRTPQGLSALVDAVR